MNSPSKPILWHQGLFLQPHHFQQNDAFVKSLLTPHNLCHSPFFWGCSRFVIQEAALSQRSIEIETCELIFQDGTWVKYPGNALIQTRSFEDLSFDVESFGINLQYTLRSYAGLGVIFRKNHLC